MAQYGKTAYWDERYTKGEWRLRFRESNGEFGIGIGLLRVVCAGMVVDDDGGW